MSISRLTVIPVKMRKVEFTPFNKEDRDFTKLTYYLFELAFP